MSLISIVLILISASIHVAWNFLTKSSRNPKVFSLLVGVFLICLAVVAILVFPVNEINREVWVYIIISGIVHALYSFALTSAYQVGDISYVYPIARSSPAFVPLAAFFILGERISLQGGLGIFSVMVGMYALLLRGEFVTELHLLWSSIKKKESRWAFATLGTVVAYSIVDKAGMSTFREIKTIDSMVQGPLYFLLENTICHLLFGTYVILTASQELGSIWKNEWSRIAAAAMGILASYSLILYVMRIEKVSYIVTLRQISVILAVLIGWFILKEKYGKTRLIASVLMLTGIYLVATAS